MPKVFEFEGTEYEFPDDATIEDFNAFMDERKMDEKELDAARAARRSERAKETEVALAACREQAKNAVLTPLGYDAINLLDVEHITITTLLVGAGALGWVGARRTLLASRPKLTRKWFGMIGSVVWQCGRCRTEVMLGSRYCGACGQNQTWPKWSVCPCQ